jgi:hypothetical protein
MLVTPGGTENEYWPGELNVAVAVVAACTTPAGSEASRTSAQAAPSTERRPQRARRRATPRPPKDRTIRVSRSIPITQWTPPLRAPEPMTARTGPVLRLGYRRNISQGNPFDVRGPLGPPSNAPGSETAVPRATPARDTSKHCDQQRPHDATSAPGQGGRPSRNGYGLRPWWCNWPPLRLARVRCEANP